MIFTSKAGSGARFPVRFEYFLRVIPADPRGKRQPEDDLKQSKQEDNLAKRHEEGLAERRHNRNLTSLEANIKIRSYNKQR